jgi:hypothetical protein
LAVKVAAIRAGFIQNLEFREIRENGPFFMKLRESMEISWNLDLLLQTQGNLMEFGNPY